MPEPASVASVCWLGGLVVVKAGTRPPRENIPPLKTMTESEINTVITEPESIPGSGNHNSHEAGLWCFSLGSVSRPHVRHVRLVSASCLFWLALVLVSGPHSAVWLFLPIIKSSKMLFFSSTWSTAALLCQKSWSWLFLLIFRSWLFNRISHWPKVGHHRAYLCLCMTATLLSCCSPHTCSAHTDNVVDASLCQPCICILSLPLRAVQVSAFPTTWSCKYFPIKALC